MKFVLFAIALLASGLRTAHADTADIPSYAGPHYVFGGSWVHRDDEASVEGQFAGLFPLFPGRGLELGPRIGVLRTLNGLDARTDFSLGAETELWIANLVGPGIAVDWVASTFRSETHARFEPFASLRLAHAFNEGAVAVRVGFPYETTMRWGLRVGLTLQLDGVPRVYEE